MLTEQQISLEYQMRLSTIINLCLFTLLCSINALGAGIDWSIAMTSFPSDHSIGDTGHEKTPYGYVDLITGNLIFDIPEVTLKGDRGLDFTLSRSYGKVNNGFRTIGNWELESPRLVMMTGPSTKLQGDIDGTGICNANGDASNSNINNKPVYVTNLLNGSYKNEVTKSYTELANATYLKSLATSLQKANLSQSGLANTSYTFNKNTALSIVSGINNIDSSGTSKVASDFDYFIKTLKDKNNSNTKALNTNIDTTNYLLNYYISNKNIAKVELIFSSSPKKSFNLSSYSNNTQSLTNALMDNLDELVLADSQLTIKFYNSSGQLVILKDNAGNTVDMMPLIYTAAYAKTLLKIINTQWPFNLKTNTTSDFPTRTRVDTRKRPISLYLPAQKNRLFYPVTTPLTGYPANAKYVSQDNWFIACSDDGKDFVARAPNGISYYFPGNNRENQTGFPTFFAGQAINGRVSIYASKVDNQFGESYNLFYKIIENENLVYEGYNSSKKFFLEKVKHALDGNELNTDGDITLSYIKFNNGVIDGKDAFSNVVGDIVLNKLNRLVNGNHIVWKAYTYNQGDLAAYKNNDSVDTSANTIGQIQDKQAAKVYLSSVGDVTGDSVSYSYGGPYRIIGNHAYNSGGITNQGQIWFYSDVTRVISYKTLADGKLIDTSTTTWNYTLNNFARPGFDESKSYRVNASLHKAKDAADYQVSYNYSAKTAGNEQTTKVFTKDVTADREKIYEYIYYSYAGGAAEDFRHGLLKKLKSGGGREESYEWTTLSNFGLIPIVKDDNSIDYKDVSYVRMNKKTVSHHGTYSTELSGFDTYGNAKTVKHTGLNGSTAVSRTTALDYFNADPASSDVQNGSLPWLVGLTKSSINGDYTNFSTTFDKYGAIATDTRNGATTTYKYQTVSFSTCLGELASFEWSRFMSCIGSYVAGSKHNGLAIEKNIGNGQLITYYSDYSKGIPRKVQNPNNSTETNSVNDFGNITEHTDADGVVSIKVYDDAGRLKEDKPVSGLSYSTISYDGLSITTTANNGGDIVSVTQYDGDGQVISTQTTSGGKPIYQTKSYDAFGNMTFESYPSLAEKPTVGISYGYDDFNRQTSINDNGTTSTYCYQNCGGTSGAISTVTQDDGVTTNQYYALGDFDLSLLANSIQKGNDNTQLVSTITYNSSLLKPTTSVLGNSKQTYTYLANGLLSTSYDHNSANEARKLTYSYDNAGRVKTLVHPDNTTEAFYYTTKIGDLISSRTWNNATASYDYTKAGRLKSSTSLDTTLVFELDSYGRTKSLTQTISAAPARTYTVGYGYNNLGQVVSMTYPNGKTIDLSNQNGFGEISKIPNVIQAISYNAWHQPTTITANANVTWDIGYDVDGKPNNITYNAFGQCQLNLGYGYDTQKRIKTISDQCAGSNQYNATLERYGTGYLKKATLSQGIYTYAYNSGDIDAVNITSQQPDVINKFYQYTYYPNTSKLKSVSWSGYSQIDYDNLNRVTNDGVRQFTYDAFGRMKTAGSDQFSYAPDNLRVRATRDSSVTDYIYGLDGELLSEINLSNNLNKNYVYIAGQMAATLESFPDTDTDYDELSDVEELEHGLNPFFPDAITDTDNDGLPDYLEKFLGLNPNNADTDGDGFSDGYEYNTLGLGAALNKDLKPTEPEPPRDDYAWMMPIINLILNDE